jgi:beta-glucuronidase
MNYVGVAWYETRCALPRLAESESLRLRVEAADHRADVWLNGRHIGSHDGGFLPFEMDLSPAWLDGEENRITIRVDSTLTMQTLPQGIDPATPPYDQAPYTRRHHFPPARFDFFPYGGLTRGVSLLVIPRSHLRSVSLEAEIGGRLRGRIHVQGSGAATRIRLLDPAGQEVVSSEPSAVRNGLATVDLRVTAPRLWSPASPDLYTACVELLDDGGKMLDRYDQQFGFREIRVEAGRLLLNGEPLYLVGCGKHEDYPVAGRVRFQAGYLRDMELLRWIGANSFRTSHYPYDEELLRLADRLGFLVIDEVPAVSLGFWSDRFDDLAPLLETHRRTLSALIERDRNHPSVILWSVVNEPNLWNEPQYQNDASKRYFQILYDHVRALDPTRPVINITVPAFGAEDVALSSCDVIGINRYYGWYTDPSDLGAVRRKLEAELEAIFRKHGKPIIVTEFGADTVEGVHSTTLQMFSEEFQTAFLQVYGEVIASKEFCAGEHVWNFSDFRTPQNHRRVVLNKKGVFTRTREPKGAAFALRQRWTALARVRPQHRPARRDDGFMVPDIRAVRPEAL